MRGSAVGWGNADVRGGRTLVRVGLFRSQEGLLYKDGGAGGDCVLLCRRGGRGWAGRRGWVGGGCAVVGRRCGGRGEASQVPGNDWASCTIPTTNPKPMFAPRPRRRLWRSRRLWREQLTASGAHTSWCAVRMKSSLKGTITANPLGRYQFGVKISARNGILQVIVLAGKGVIDHTH
jgi:hypothetical protein